MSDVLDQIVLKTRERLGIQKNRASLKDLEKKWQQMPPAHSFEKALKRELKWAVIAELKQASPSAGVIRKEGDMAGRIKAYVFGGAAALSILTEEHYFNGSTQFLELARSLTDIPLLRKDFIVDPYQIDESRVLGADAILLIATLLPGSLLKEFLQQAAETGLQALVEVHNEADLEHALNSGAAIIGVNNRDLRTLKVDLETAKRLLPMIPQKGKTIVVESGIRSPDDLTPYGALGAHAVLMGETLMRDDDPKRAVHTYSQLFRMNS